MDKILIKKTSKTPAIDFDYESGILEIRGVSIPEDADNFYAPLLEWVSKYVEKTKEAEEDKQTCIRLKLIYFNTSTADYLVSILKTLKTLSESVEDKDSEPNPETDEEDIEDIEDLSDAKFVIEWHYEEDDEDMRETGAHFESIIDLPFVYTACEEID